MYLSVLNISTAVLFLSSVLFLCLLTKKITKANFTSTNVILTFSDILNSVLTAFMLLLHESYSTNDNNLTNELFNTTNTLKNHEIKSFEENSCGEGKQILQDLNTEETCSFKNILLQHAIFFVPFVNAFVSLLSLSIKCHADVAQLNSRCNECTEIQTENCFSCSTSESVNIIEFLDDKSLSKRIREIQSEEHPIRRRATSYFKRFCNSSDSNKYIKLTILSQWLLPLIFAATFQLGDYQTMQFNEDSPDEAFCSFLANYPFDSCPYAYEVNETYRRDLPNATLSQNKFIDSDDTLLWPNPNSSKADVVVSGIYKIIQESMNDLNSTRQKNVSSGITSDIVLKTYQNIINGSAFEFKKFNYSFNPRTEKEIVLFNHNETVYGKNSSLQNCIKNRCVMSSNFFQIHVFLLFIIIYFVPIVICTVLLVLSHYKFTKTIKKLQSLESKSNKQEVNQEEPHVTTKYTKDRSLNEESQTIENQSTKRNMDKEPMIAKLTCQVQTAQSIFQLFKINAVIVVATWTPVFLEILSKIHFCSNIPGWLTELTFIVMALFAVFKNLLNLTVIKIETAAESSQVRSNSIYPEPSTSTARGSF